MNNKIKELENELYMQVENSTPEYIKKRKLIDIDNKEEFVFKFKREYLYPYDEVKNPLGLNLNEWLINYEKEAKVSTAGIRGPQNILYPEDTRFPINMIGIMLATIAKALVAKEKYTDKDIYKIVGREVRYNSSKMQELIARIQAAQGIRTLITKDRKTIPIWLASFLAFKLDLLGGEYITSSHGISVKNATKDLNSQGSQYLPEESLEFVNKIKQIFEYADKNGSYNIKISANDSEYIDESIMEKLNDGIDLYYEYLKSGVANDENIELIKNAKLKTVIENVGGSAYRTLSKLLAKLGIDGSFDWFNIEEDPFFHGIGKYDHDPKGNKAFYDYSVDATVLSKKPNGEQYFPVIETLNYKEKLKDYPIGTAVLITDPDHDRLTVCQIEDEKNVEKIKEAGIDYVNLDNGRVLTVLTANQSFLLIMDFWYSQLKKSGKLEEHPRFIIKTTASAMSWDEWAHRNKIKVVNVPVGFKEIANVMKKVEKQIGENPQKPVVVTDVFGKEINLGVNPRLIFGGEESGGMIIGSNDLITSKAGRIAIAMREKSATEAIIVASALVSKLNSKNLTLSQALIHLFETNKIIAKYDVREDISYYNESEPDINKLKEAKKAGELKRTSNDLFYLTLALAKIDKKITINDVITIFNSLGSKLDFSNLKDIKFVGDGTYLEFTDKFIEIRPSGTDAKTKAYGSGDDKDNIIKYARFLGNYSGELNNVYKRIINEKDYNDAKESSLKRYLEFANKDSGDTLFEIPDYTKTLNLK